MRVFPEGGKGVWKKKGAFGLDEVQLEDPRALDDCRAQDRKATFAGIRCQLLSLSLEGADDSTMAGRQNGDSGQPATPVFWLFR